jgi:hypothetical protein
MKTTRSHLPHLCTLILLALALGIPRFAGGQIITNWVAYNDQVPNYTAVNGWVTHPRATTIDMGESSGSGNLTNFYNGQQLPVTLSSAHTGATHAFGLAVAPAINTPAAQIFRGIVDISNEGSAQPAGNLIGIQFSPSDYATITFSGLDPNKHYIFRGTATRGGSYPLRWSVATIIGAQTFVDAHINGNGGPPVLTSNTYPASLVAGQAAWNAGDNRAGAVIGWDFITPAPDGTFSIQSSNYVGQIPGGTAANNTYSYAIDAMLLAEVEVAPPSITQQPAAQTNVEQNRPFSLSVGASGTPLFYQWYKQGSGAISGATFPTYSVSQAAFPGDSGDYYVVVYNPLARRTSSVARVTVSADVTGPGIATAFSYPTVDFATQAASLNQVIIEFNEPIQAAGATDPTHYVISGGIGNPSSVILTNGSTVALQLSTALAEDTAYTVQVSGIVDVVGNNVSNGGTNNPAPFRSWMRGPGNGLLFEVFDNIAGSDVVNLTSDPSYPDQATFRTNLWIFDSRAALPDDTRENYGSRTRGVFIPPVSGDWFFYLRGVDISRLYLNPTGLDSAGKQLIADEAHADTDGNWGRIVSNPISLRAGRGYYIEALQKSDTGPDVVKVAARLVGTGVPPGVPNTQLDTNAVMGAAVASPLAPRDLGGTLTITQQPANANVEDGHDAIFSVQVTNPSGLPVQYQWFKDGTTEIPGANGPTYTFIATSADSGHTFSVRAAKVGSVVTSQSATLTVRPDTTPPHAIEAIGHYTNLFDIIVRFDERILPADATEPFDYNLHDTVGNLSGPPVSGILLPDGKSVIIHYDTALTAGQAYELDVIDVHDLVGLQISPNPTTLRFTAGEGGKPRLTVSYADYYVYVSWPAPSTGFVLEQSSSLSAPNWTTVTQTPAVANGRNTVTITPGAGAEARFYRLRQ